MKFARWQRRNTFVTSVNIIVGMFMESFSLENEQHSEISVIFTVATNFTTGFSKFR